MLVAVFDVGTRFDWPLLVNHTRCAQKHHFENIQSHHGATYTFIMPRQQRGSLLSDETEHLLNLTTAHLDKGLRGIPVGTCRTSFVTSSEGVHYCGYPIADLVGFGVEEIFHLLLYKELPDAEQAESFSAELATRGEIPQSIISILESLPNTGHPMDWMAIGISAIGMIYSKEDWVEDTMNLVAKMPRLMGLIFRIRSGRGENIPDDDLSLGLVDRFILTLDQQDVDHDIMRRIVSTFLVLHMDHGGGNLSTFTGKAIASGKATIFASIAGAMNALSGPLHGRANQSCLEFIKRIGTSDAVEVEKFVRNELAEHRPIYGFGHAVLKCEDPRATIQLALGEELCPHDELYKTVKTLRDVASRVLGENPKISNPNANVDLASGCLLNYAGFTDSDYYTTFFGWARVCGIAAQIIDERMVMRSGKGIPIYRPKYMADRQSLRRL